MKKILFLTPQIPYPAVSGGLLKSLRLLEHLNEQSEVSVFVLDKEAEGLALSNLKALLPNLSFTSYALNKGRSIKNYLKSWVLGLPLAIYRNRSLEAGRIAAGIAVDCDVIVVDHYLMFQYIPEGYSGRVVLHTHNAEFMIWKSFSDNASNIFVKLAVYVEYLRVRRYELSIVRSSDYVLAAPNDEKAFIQAGAKPGKGFIKTMHLGDDALINTPNLSWNASGYTVAFIGTLSWAPNAEGLSWFIEKVWPLVIARLPNARLLVVGSGTNERLASLARSSENTEFMGFVSDLELIYRQSKVFVAPLMSGAGIKVKVVSALYRGIPSVTTPHGVEGIGCIEGEHILVERTDAAFAEAVIRLCVDQTLWEKLSDASRNYARDNLTWAGVFKGFDISMYGQ